MSKQISNTSGVYRIFHKDSGKSYIGSSSNISSRFRQHKHELRKGIHKNKKLQNAWSKYGEIAFEFEVVEVVHNEEDLVCIEQRYIDATNCVVVGFNLRSTAGRERAGVKHTAESIEKMSKAQKGKVISSEHREKLRIAFAGRKFSDEHRNKISEAKTGIKRAQFSDDTRANMSVGQKGRKHSQETRLKLSMAHKGKVISLESRARMSEAQKKRYAKNAPV